MDGGIYVQTNRQIDRKTDAEGEFDDRFYQSFRVSPSQEFLFYPSTHTTYLTSSLLLPPPITPPLPPPLPPPPPLAPSLTPPPLTPYLTPPPPSYYLPHFISFPSSSSSLKAKEKKNEGSSLLVAFLATMPGLLQPSFVLNSITRK